MATETDNLLDDVRAAAVELETGEKPVVETPAIEAPEESPAERTERERDEAGRFKAKSEDDKPRETLKLKDKPAETPAVAAAPVETPPAKDAPKPLEGLEIPPVNWKGSAKISWGKLPAPVRQELVEQHARVAQAEAEVAPFRELIDSHKQLLINEAGTTQAGMQALFSLARMSVDNPAGLIHHIAQSRGIDLRALVGGQQGAQPGTQPQQPDIESIIDQRVQQRLQPFEAQIAQRENQQLQSTIEAFRADPKHPYFEDVKVHMGQLLKAGIAADMHDAYDKAVKLNPAIQSQLEAQRTEEAQRKQAAEVQKARKALGASLRGSPLPGATNGTGGQGSSVLDDVRAAASELAGA